MTPLRRRLRTLWWVYRYDTLQHLRDPLTLLLVIGVPVLLYPLMGGLTWALQERDKSSRDAEIVEVMLLGEAAAITPHLPDTVTVVPTTDDPAIALRDRSIDAYMEADGAELVVHFDTSRASSRTARSRLNSAGSKLRRALGEELLVANGAPLPPASVLEIDSEDIRTNADWARSLLGRALPLVLILISAMGGLYAALDLVTGEKERGTLETLLITPAERTTVMLAKLGAVTTIAAVAPLLSMVSTLTALRVLWPDNQLFATSAWYTLPLTVLLLVPMVLFIAAGCTFAASLVPDFKSGQVYALPALLIPQVLAAPAALPDVQLGVALALLPVTNIAVALRDVVTGRFDPGLVALAAVVGLGQAGVLVSWAGRSLGSEAVLLGTRGSHHRRLLGNYVPDALGIFAASFLLLWFIGQAAQAADVVIGTLVTQWLLFAPLAVAAVWWVGLERAETLQLRRPALRDLGLSVLVGIGAPGLAHLVLAAQELVIPTPTAQAELLGRMLTTGQPLIVLWLAFALTPAVCEELLFRGAILGLVRRTLGVWGSLLLTSLLFGLLHLSAYRILPTAAPGLLMGVLAIRSRSIFPAMIVHLLNNGLSISGLVPESRLAQAGLALLTIGAAWSVGRGGRR